MPKMRISRKAFFKHIKGPLFNHHFTQEQVDGLDALLDVFELDDIQLSVGHMANIFAQVYHETGRKMGPVREGFAKSDAAARRAVKKLYDNGVISRNYALPHANGNSYYGRGQIQLTHGDNYKKLSVFVGVDLYASPDLALAPKIGAKIAVYGMIHGSFTGKALADYSAHDHFNMREIVNGDKNKRGKDGVRIGTKIANYAHEFENAIVFEKVPEPKVEVPVKSVTVDTWNHPVQNAMTLWDRFIIWIGAWRA